MIQNPRKDLANTLYQNYNYSRFFGLTGQIFVDVFQIGPARSLKVNFWERQK